MACRDRGGQSQPGYARKGGEVHVSSGGTDGCPESWPAPPATPRECRVPGAGGGALPLAGTVRQRSGPSSCCCRGSGFEPDTFFVIFASYHQLLKTSYILKIKIFALSPELLPL